MAPYFTCLLVGLGGLFYGVTGPLLSTFVPILVRNALGDHRTLIGMVMAIDNVLLLLLVPWAGVISDRAAGRRATGTRTPYGPRDGPLPGRPSESLPLFLPDSA
jgi:MFS family permease